ncbi:MAG: type II toxin-antitoxin system VapC family toxin [Chthoniobacterales bacterium]
MIFADSSFLVSLYLPNDRFSASARRIAISFRDAVAYPLLVELELTNTIWRAVGEKRIPARLAASLLSAVNRDLTEGFLVRSALNAVAHYRDAIKLSTEYGARYLTRTLDVLHVAAALLLEAKILASFDDRQRRLAASVGLKLVPETLR